MEEEATNKRNEADILIDDVLVLILRCLTARTLCCCKCVYFSWYRLIYESEHRKELPKFVVEFMYGNWKGKRRFTSFTGEYPYFSFLPFPIQILSHPCFSFG